MALWKIAILKKLIRNHRLYVFNVVSKMQIMKRESIVVQFEDTLDCVFELYTP